MPDLRFEPTSVTLPEKEPDGYQILGRMTTTSEQRREAEDWLLGEMQKQGVTEARATIFWTRGEPTVLDMRARIERIAGGVLYTADQVQEFTLAGAEILDSPHERMKRLIDEVSELTKTDAL